MSKKSDIATALLGIVTAIILWLTILSREKLIGTPIVYMSFHEFVSLWQSVRQSRVIVHFIGNIVIFLPLGFLFPLVSEKQRWYRTVRAGFCFSLLIETIQLISKRGCFDPDDIILNTLGTVIGYGLYRVILHK